MNSTRRLKGALSPYSRITTTGFARVDDEQYKVTIRRVVSLLLKHYDWLQIRQNRCFTVLGDQRERSFITCESPNALFQTDVTQFLTTNGKKFQSLKINHTIEIETEKPKLKKLYKPNNLNKNKKALPFYNKKEELYFLIRLITHSTNITRSHHSMSLLPFILLNDF
jgi:hypothetical protein